MDMDKLFIENSKGFRMVWWIFTVDQKLWGISSFSRKKIWKKIVRVTEFVKKNFFQEGATITMDLELKRIEFVNEKKKRL